MQWMTSWLTQNKDSPSSYTIIARWDYHTHTHAHTHPLSLSLSLTVSVSCLYRKRWLHRISSAGNLITILTNFGGYKTFRPRLTKYCRRCSLASPVALTPMTVNAIGSERYCRRNFVSMRSKNGRDCYWLRWLQPCWAIQSETYKHYNGDIILLYVSGQQTGRRQP